MRDQHGYTAVTEAAAVLVGPVREITTDDEEDFRVHLAAVALDAEIRATPAISCRLERGSIYTVALCMPQIARSADWPTSLLVECIRCYAFLMLYYSIVLTLLYMVVKEEHVWDKFAEQMHLCDFGAFMSQCPGGANCMGPAGTPYEPKRLFSWDEWVQRVFVKESLVDLFPHMRDEINEKIDPGEYGLEDYWCRFVCTFCFFLAMMEELLNILRLTRLLYSLPSEATPWIRFDTPVSEEGTGINRESAEESVSIKMRGMPLRWKITHLVAVLLPKSLICQVACRSGTVFLMETAGIEDVIVNAVALMFIMQLDNMVYDHMFGRATRLIMDRVEDWHNPVVVEVSLARGAKHTLRRGIREIWHSFNGRLESVCILTAVFMLDYYSSHCIQVGKDWTGLIGGWVARPAYFPKSINLSPLAAFFPSVFEVEEESTPYWTMPGMDDA